MDSPLEITIVIHFQTIRRVQELTYDAEVLLFGYNATSGAAGGVVYGFDFRWGAEVSYLAFSLWNTD